jgi:hypothetical protein
MAKKKSAQPVPSPVANSAPQERVETSIVAPLPAGTVVLRVERLDANRQVCAAGTVIAPNVEGWPVHRVASALQHGYARQD